MLLRELNAGFSLVTTLFALAHAISLSAWMLSQGRITPPGKTLPWMLTCLVVVHVLLSICLMISGHKGQKGPKGRAYPKLNQETMVQRITGILMLVFTALHILGATGIMQPPPLIHAIVPPLFFTIVLAHVAVSTPKALITLGFGNTKFIKISGIVIKVICIATLVADIVGFYLYVC